MRRLPGSARRIPGPPIRLAELRDQLDADLWPAVTWRSRDLVALMDAEGVAGASPARQEALRLARELPGQGRRGRAELRELAA